MLDRYKEIVVKDLDDPSIKYDAHVLLLPVKLISSLTLNPLVIFEKGNILISHGDRIFLYKDQKDAEKRYNFDVDDIINKIFYEIIIVKDNIVIFESTPKKLYMLEPEELLVSRKYIHALYQGTDSINAIPVDELIKKDKLIKKEDLYSSINYSIDEYIVKIETTIEEYQSKLCYLKEEIDNFKEKVSNIDNFKFIAECKKIIQ